MISSTETLVTGTGQPDATKQTAAAEGPSTPAEDATTASEALTPTSQTPEPAEASLEAHGKETHEQQQQQEQQQPDEYITGLHFYVLMGSLVMACLLAALNGSMLGTATPSITTTFHSINDVGWYGSSLLIASSAMMPLTGKIFALFRLKVTYITFIAILEIGALISGVSTSSMMLIIGRAICGIGTSGVITGAVTVIAVVRPMEKRPFLVGVLMGCVACGQIAGPLLGGALSEVTWRWCFYINLPLGGIVVFFLLFFVRLPTRLATGDRDLSIMHRLRKIDFVGFVIFAAACSLFLTGLQWGGTTYPWSSGQVIGLLTAGGVLMFAFAGWCIFMGDLALIPPRLLRDRINFATTLTAFTQSGGIFILMYFLPIWFQAIKGASPVMSGVMILPTIVSTFLTSFSCGYLVQRTGYYLPEILFGNALVTVAGGLFTTFKTTTGAGDWIGFQILAGAGRGIVMQLLITVIQANVDAEDVPVGTSFVMFAQYFGGAIFICVARTVLTSKLSADMATFAPGVDPNVVINTGITELRQHLPPDIITLVLEAYNESIVSVWYVQLGLSATAFVFSWFLGWKDVRKRREPADAETGAADASHGEKA